MRASLEVHQRVKARFPTLWEIKRTSSWEPLTGIEDVADSISSVVREAGFNARNQLSQICVWCQQQWLCLLENTFVLRLGLALQVKKAGLGQTTM